MTDIASELHAGPTYASLRTGQLTNLVIFGAIGWFAAAMLARTIGPMGAFDGINMVILYGLIVPGTIPIVLVVRKFAGLKRHQMFVGMSVLTMSALFLDGMAVAWFPSLYGSDTALVANSAAAILWGAGVGMALGLVMGGADPSSQTH